MESNSNTSQRSFFDLLALADVERVHSAVIGWLLSDDCKALAIEERSQVLHKLFGVEKNQVYKEIEVKLEWENIDILWKTKEKSGAEACWVLENKIKSSQHSNQLKKYKKCVEKIYQDQASYCFLTVIGEPAKSREYKNRTYADLVAILKPYFEGTKAEPHWIIAREYFETIRRMTEVTKVFLNNASSFPEVFSQKNANSSKIPKEISNAISNAKDYIKTHKIEVLMQKFLQYNIMKEVVETVNAIGGKISENPDYKIVKDWHVGETNQNADMAIHFENYPEVYPEEEKNTKERYWIYSDDNEIPYQFDISFQRGSFKFAVSDRYWHTESWENQDKVKTFVDTWTEIFKKLKKNQFEEFEWGSINAPRGNRKGENKRSRISISLYRKKGNKSKKADVQWYELVDCGFQEIVIKCFVIAFDLRRKAIEAYKSNHEQDINSWREENKQNIERKAKAEAKKKTENNGEQQPNP